MIYQLPDGRIINISVEEFLRMDDQMEQAYMASKNSGYYANSPFHQSKIMRSNTSSPDKEDETMDFTPDQDEIKSEQDFDINNIPDE